LVVEKGNEFKKPFKKDGTYTLHVSNYIGDDIIPVSGPFSRVAFRVVDLDKPVEIKNFLLDLGWVPKEWNEDGNGTPTSPKLSKDDPFEGIKGGLGKLIAKRVQCKHRLSNLNGWTTLIREDGRIPAKVSGFASTGRIRHKDIVNVPSPHSGAFFARQMREIFIARPGWVMVGADSKGNQIRQLAARMGDEEYMTAACQDKDRDGTDFHEYNMALCGDIPRSRAKNFFYGYIFGARAPTIAKQIKGTTAEAQRLIDLYTANLLHFLG